MPIVRSYQCSECFHRVEVTLDASEWDAPAPSCQVCEARALNQVFKPVALGGSVASRAARIAEDIIANDYGVANFTPDNREGGVGKVAYKDQTTAVMGSNWQQTGHRAMLETAFAIGKQTRRENGGMDGLDMLKRGLANGTQVDLIEASKRRAIKVW